MTTEQEVRQLIFRELYPKDEFVWLSMPNSRLDFESEFVFFGYTPNGRLKLGEVYASGPEGIKTKMRFADIDVQEDCIKIRVAQSQYIKKICFKQEVMLNATAN